MTRPLHRPRHSGVGTLEKVAHLLGVFLATFEAITLHAALSGSLAAGALQGLVVLGAALAFLFSRIRSSAVRKETAARVAMTVSIAAIVCAVVLSGRIAEVQGAASTSVLLRTLLVLLFQMGWAVTFWLTICRRQRGQSRYVPAAIGGVVLIGGGFFLSQGASPAFGSTAADEAATGGEVFKQFATADDYPFASETERAGEDGGSVFAHYHAGREPLIGLGFDTKDWFGRTRISDLEGIFEPGASVDGAHRLEGRPGFVVASVEVQADDHVNALRVEFAPFDGEFLQPDGWYWSDWAGSYERGAPTIRLDGGTQLVVGIRGSSGMVMNSMSLLTADPLRRTARR